MPIRLNIIESPSGVKPAKQSMTFQGDGETVGRGRNNTWVLSDPSFYLSGNHLRITQESGNYYLTDTSTNGTFINSSREPVGKGCRTQLYDGDELAIGDYKLTVSLGSERADRLKSPSSKTQLSQPEPVRSSSNLIDQILLDDLNLDNSVKEGLPPERLSQDSLFQESDLNSALSDNKPTNSNLPFDIDLVDLTLIQSLGIGHHELSDKKIKEINQEAGKVIREVVKGTLELLLTRSKVKHLFDVDVTKIHPVKNNPLKFSVSLDEAVANMFVAKGESYTPPLETITETFENMIDHEIAMLAGVEQIFDQVISTIESGESDKLTRDFLNQAFSSTYQKEIRAHETKRREKGENQG